VLGWTERAPFGSADLHGNGNCERNGPQIKPFFLGRRFACMQSHLIQEANFYIDWRKIPRDPPKVSPKLLRVFSRESVQPIVPKQAKKFPFRSAGCHWKQNCVKCIRFPSFAVQILGQLTPMVEVASSQMVRVNPIPFVCRRRFACMQWHPIQGSECLHRWAQNFG
jgi:hypothetical protein